MLLRPATVEQIIDIAHGGELMPPKTTFFWPKPRTGQVFRLLDDATEPAQVQTAAGRGCRGSRIEEGVGGGVVRRATTVTRSTARR